MYGFESERCCVRHNLFDCGFSQADFECSFAWSSIVFVKYSNLDFSYESFRMVQLHRECRIATAFICLYRLRISLKNILTCPLSIFWIHLNIYGSVQAWKKNILLLFDTELREKKGLRWDVVSFIQITYDSKRKHFAIVKVHFIEFQTFEFRDLVEFELHLRSTKTRVKLHIIFSSIPFDSSKYFSTCMNASTIRMAKLNLLWNIQWMYAIIKISLSLFVFIFYF